MRSNWLSVSNVYRTYRGRAFTITLGSGTNRVRILVTGHPHHMSIVLVYDGGSHHAEPVPINMTAYGRSLTPTPRVLSPREYSKRKFSFYEFGSMLDTIAGHLMTYWKPGPKAPPQWLRAWRHEKYRKVLGRAFKERWKEIVAHVDPTVLAVHKACYAALGPGHRITYESPLLSDEFYRRMPYCVQDIIKYRSAAMIIPNIANDWYAPVGHPAPRFWDHLDNWRGFPTYDGLPYRSMNKTLDNFPGGVPFSIMGDLKYIRLPFPIYERSVIIAVSRLGNWALRRHHYTDRMNNRIDPSIVHHNAGPILRATPAEIKKAVKIMGRYHHWDDDVHSFRKATGVVRTINWIMDYPDVHDGRLVGLAEKSRDWHRQQAEAYSAAEIARAGGEDTETARPPISLPDDPRIKFLSTVGEVFHEGNIMGHCVRSYAGSAVQGHCYLFHVDYRDQMATVEVSSECRRVVQSQGPGDYQNAATRWATRAINKWAEGLDHAWAMSLGREAAKSYLRRGILSKEEAEICLKAGVLTAEDIESMQTEEDTADEYHSSPAEEEDDVIQF